MCVSVFALRMITPAEARVAADIAGESYDVFIPSDDPEARRRLARVEAVLVEAQSIGLEVLARGLKSQGASGRPSHQSSKARP